MLDFNDVPLGSPVGAGVGAANAGAAKLAITALWPAWLKANPPAAPVALPPNIQQLAYAMAADTKGAMPVAACVAYCGIYLVQNGPNLAAANFMAGLPPHHRGRADELLGIAASLAVANDQGYTLWGSRKDVNALLSPAFWTKPWQGDGPDYLLSSHNEFAFLEVKGCATGVQKMPRRFANYKTQSVNAILNFALLGLGAMPPIKYLLSYAYFPANLTPGPLMNSVVQWFNARLPSSQQASTPSHVLVIAIALSQFRTQMRNAGFSPELILDSVRPPENLFRIHGTYSIENTEGLTHAIGFSKRAHLLFQQISRFFSTHGKLAVFEDVALEEAVSYAKELRLLPKHAPRKVRWRGHDQMPLHVYDTGVFIVGPHS